MLLASIEATAWPSKQGQHRDQDVLNATFKQGDHEPIDFSTDSLSGLDETAMWIIPASFVNEPLLDKHGTQLGIQFAQNPPLFFAVPFINVSRVFPEPEKPLNLPAES